MTDATPSPARRPTASGDVVAGQLVPVDAVRVPPSSGRTTASSKVFLERYRLKMRRVDATSRPALVVQLQAFWYRPNQQLVHQSMDVVFQLSMARAVILQREHCIAVPRQRRLP